MTRVVVESKAQGHGQSINRLVSAGPDGGLAEQLDLFGQFVGDWTIDMEWSVENGPNVHGRGEAHFGHILEGKAVQEVWTARSDKESGRPVKEFMGTVLRFYESALDKWRCIWVEPARGIVQQFEGGKIGEEIVLEGTSLKGYPERWVYYDIKPDSFRWRGLESMDHKKTWKLTDQIYAQRVQH